MPNVETFEHRGFTRLLVRWLIRRYYPHIEITDADRIGQSGPVLLCANHGNALIDPVLIGIAARRPVRFMAKAPLFGHPILGRPMQALGMIPAFRGGDDPRQVRRNLESLDVGAKVLVDGHAMGIFPEGQSTDQAHLEMVRSGAARMAVAAAEEGAKGVQIVPIGITYERKEQFRSGVWVRVGEPISVDDWLQQHAGDGRKARRTVTSELERRLKQVVVHLDEPQWEPWLNDLECFVPPPADAAKTKARPLRQRKRIADAMNYFLTADRPRAESVAERIKAYRDQVQAAGLRVDSPVLCTRGFMMILKLLGNVLLLALLLIPAILGALHHLVPFVVVRTIASRLDQPGLKTVSTHRLMVGVPGYVLWYGVVALWMFGNFSAWLAWAWLITMPFAGLLALHFWARAGQSSRLLRQLVFAVFRRTRLRQLREELAALRQHVMALSEEYRKVSPPPPVSEGQPFRWFRVIGVTTCVVVAITIVWFGLYWWRDASLHRHGLDLPRLSESQLSAYLDADEMVILQIIEGLDELELDARQVQGDFAAGRRSYVNQADNDSVRELLRRYMSYRTALFRILWKYQRHAELTDERLKLETFLLDFTAASLLYEASLKFVNQFNRSSETVAKLNEPEPNWDIPAGLYDTIKRNLTSRKNIDMWQTARRYYQEQENRFGATGLGDADPYRQFHDAIAGAEDSIIELHQSVNWELFEVAFRDLETLVKRVQYTTQSAVSTLISYMKIREPRGGKPLIGAGQLAQLRDLLKPGDILLERRNWHLSNAFLPGFWPHGAVYVGNAHDLEQRGLEQNEHVRHHWAAFKKPDHDGHEHVIIEALGQGVIFSSLEHSVGGADSVAVLRPVLKEKEKNKAIVHAFSFAGRPYDFEFDFSTTDKLVCTELIYRAYGGNSGPITFPVVAIMGRPTMPANKLVEKFAAEREGGVQQLEFIAFIDGDERTGTAKLRTDADAFIRTVDRSRFTGSPINPLGWVLLSLTALCMLAAILFRRKLCPPAVPEQSA